MEMGTDLWRPVQQLWKGVLAMKVRGWTVAIDGDDFYFPIYPTRKCARLAQRIFAAAWPKHCYRVVRVP